MNSSKQGINFHTKLSGLCNKNLSSNVKLLKLLPQHMEERRKILLGKIEQVIIDILKRLCDNNFPEIQLRNTTIWKNCEFNEYLSLKNDGDATQHVISYRFIQSRERFSKILYLLYKVYRMLMSSSYCTQRELYYQNVELFQSQPCLNGLVRIVCNLLDALPWELSIQATSKGLIAGALTIRNGTGEIIDFMKSGGTLIPQDIMNLRDFKSEAKFILLVEKDAAFQKLLDEDVLHKLGPVIIITGKGFPDINSRLMLKRLWEELQLPVLALVDADPHGIEIMCVYRFGSLGMSQQGKVLSVPSVKWLGLHPTDIAEFSIKGIPLTRDATNKAKSLLKRPYITSNEKLLEQVIKMIENNTKCEIEALSHISPSYLSDVYIKHKISCMELI